MDKSRRNLLKASASAAVGGILINAHNMAAAQSADNATQIQAVPPLAGKIGMRLATCVLRPGAAPTVAAVLDDGRLVDLKAEAQRQNVKLGFDATSMLALIASGNEGFERVKMLVERAAQRKSGLPALGQARLLSPIPRPERNIYCVGWNYLDHFEEGKKARADKVVEKLPDHPVEPTR
jgi:hypothetical protein